MKEVSSDRASDLLEFCSLQSLLVFDLMYDRYPEVAQTASIFILADV